MKHQNIWGYLPGFGLTLWQSVHGDSLVAFFTQNDIQSAVRTGFSAVVLGFLSAMGQQFAAAYFKKLRGK